jgi:hypothetical protein
VRVRAMWLAMWLDALLCLQHRRLARWTAVTVDRFDGEEYPMPFVRFRWRRSVDTWIERMTGEWLTRGQAVTFAARELAQAQSGELA